MDEYIGAIKLFAGNFAPKGYRLCDGAELPIQQYQVLFSIFGVTYGGDGQRTFALPDLRAVAPASADGPTWILCAEGNYPSRD